MSIIEILIIINLLLSIVVLFLLLTRRSAVTPQTGAAADSVAVVKENIDRLDNTMRNEFSSNRREAALTSQAIREELANSFRTLSDLLAGNSAEHAKNQKNQLEDFGLQLEKLKQENTGNIEKLIASNEKTLTDFKIQMTEQAKENAARLATSFKESQEVINRMIEHVNVNGQKLTEDLDKSSKATREESTASLRSFEERFTNNVKEFNELQRQKFGDLLTKQDQIRSETELKLERIRETVEKKLIHLQEENAKKLEEMRATVDEKLHATLEKRFTESFTVISNRLEMVHKGLGEMQSLASNVGDLKKVMSNVKSRGILGEYQLANILEDLLTNEQYEKNVKTKAGSGAIVEFAIKMPNDKHLEKVLWLPIDSKFPKEDYDALVEAYETGDLDAIEQFKRSFKAAIIKSARDIREKYIDPPNTTEYAIMFLPFESLYAEVLRTPGLFETILNQYKVTITGPTTLSALLNSLQMGFRTLAIEKRSGEVWDLLSVVKKEFGQFGDVLEKTKKKLQEATNTITSAGVRSRAIERQLKKVQQLPSASVELRLDDEITDEMRSVEDEE